MQPNSRRHKQVANAIREELVTILRKDISDPRLEAAGMITVSGVDVSEDMRNATVWISFMGKEEKAPGVKQAMEALKSAAGFIHRLLIKRISMKVHPHVSFRFDPMFDRAAVVNEALHSASQVERETASARAAMEGEPSSPSEDQDPEKK